MDLYQVESVKSSLDFLAADWYNQIQVLEQEKNSVDNARIIRMPVKASVFRGNGNGRDGRICLLN